MAVFGFLRPALDSLHLGRVRPLVLSSQTQPSLPWRPERSHDSLRLVTCARCDMHIAARRAVYRMCFVGMHMKTFINPLIQYSLATICPSNVQQLKTVRGGHSRVYFPPASFALGGRGANGSRRRCRCGCRRVFTPIPSDTAAWCLMPFGGLLCIGQEISLAASWRRVPCWIQLSCLYSFSILKPVSSQNGSIVAPVKKAPCSSVGLSKSDFNQLFPTGG